MTLIVSINDCNKVQVGDRVAVHYLDRSTPLYGVILSGPHDNAYDENEPFFTLKIDGRNGTDDAAVSIVEMIFE